MFGQKLKELRLLKNISSENLAEDLNISKTMVWSFEMNKKEPSNAHLLIMADYFNITVDHLLQREEKCIIDFTHSIDEVMDKYILSVDNVRISKVEVLDSIAYDKAKRIMMQQNLI
ncbi:MAG: helix-turn-helix domain-containing protein [Paenisporosarcina sp.]